METRFDTCFNSITLLLNKEYPVHFNRFNISCMCKTSDKYCSQAEYNQLINLIWLLLYLRADDLNRIRNLSCIYVSVVSDRANASDVKLIFAHSPATL